MNLHILQTYKILTRAFIFLSIFILSVGIFGSYANAGFPPPTPTPLPCDGWRLGVDGTSNGICVRTFQPFEGITRYGLLPAIANLFETVLLLLVIMWVINLFLIIYHYIKNKGNEDEAEKAWQYIQYVWQGTSFVLGGVVVFSVLGFMFGVGTPFDWADGYTQCGFESDKTIYNNARDEIFQNPAVSSGDELRIACCEVGAVTDGWYVTELNGASASIPPAYNPPSFYCTLERSEVVP